MDFLPLENSHSISKLTRTIDLVLLKVKSFFFFFFFGYKFYIENGKNSLFKVILGWRDHGKFELAFMEKKYLI